MLQKKWVRLSLVLGFLALGIAAVWLFWAQELAPIEAGVLGTWTTPIQADGTSTVMLLRPDHTCQVQWLDHDSNAAHPPRDGQWWVEGKTLFVDASDQLGLIESISRAFTGRKKSPAWPIVIQEETLVLGPDTLRRRPHAPP